MQTLTNTHNHKKIKQYTTPLSLGFFQGVIVVMANQCLIMFGIFAGESQNDPNDKAAGWFSATTFFLFINYAIFGGMLAIFRSDLVKEDITVAAPGKEGATDLPQAAVPPGTAN